VQQEIYPNLYEVEIIKHSEIFNFKGILNKVGMNMYLIENVGIEINVFVLLMIMIGFIAIFSKIFKIKKSKFVNILGIVKKIFVMMFAFFYTDYLIIGYHDFTNAKFLPKANKKLFGWINFGITFSILCAFNWILVILYNTKI
jgi:hypothetical protein